MDVRPCRPLALAACLCVSEGSGGGLCVGRDNTAVVGDTAVIPVASAAVDVVGFASGVFMGIGGILIADAVPLRRD